MLKSTHRAAEQVPVPMCSACPRVQTPGGTGGALHALAGAVMLIPSACADSQLSTVPLTAEENKLEGLSAASLPGISSSADTSTWHMEETRNEATASA